MRRREFIALVGATVARPLAAGAQQSSAVRRIGVLMGLAEDDAGSQARLMAFRQELGRLGWIEGRNIWIDYRWASGDPVRAQAYAKDLIALSPEVFLAGGGTAMTALGQQTRTIPIVFANASDQIGTGLVASLARPGGNVTGFTGFEHTMAGKLLEMLKEAAPGIDRVAILFNPETGPGSRSHRSLESAAASIGLRAILAPVRDVAAIDGVIPALGPEPGGGLVVLNDIFTLTHRKPIIALASRYRLPAVYAIRAFAADGGLMSYGADVTDLYRGAASYIDRILKGEKPADLPVQQPTKFELVINLKAATALGLTVPPALLVAADEVIE
jgi:putative tryptophan/tyrosine transport system substrate-binding protein